MPKSTKDGKSTKQRQRENLNKGAKKIIQDRKRQLESINTKLEEDIRSTTSSISALDKISDFTSKSTKELLDESVKWHAKLGPVKDSLKKKLPTDGKKKKMSDEEKDKYIASTSELLDQVDRRQSGLAKLINSIMKQIAELKKAEEGHAKMMNEARGLLNQFATNVVDEHQEMLYISSMNARRGASGDPMADGKSMELITSIFRLQNKHPSAPPPPPTGKGKTKGKKAKDASQM